MKKVLLSVHKFFPLHRAGTEVLTLKVSQELQRRGYEVLVVTANPPDLDARHAAGPQTSDYVFEGVPVHVVEESLRLSPGYSFKHEYYHPEMHRHLDAVIKKFAPDIVHVFHAQNLSSAIVKAAQDNGLPVYCSTTDFWFVCPIVQLKRPDGSVCRGPEPMAANCLTCYTPKLFAPMDEFSEAVHAKRASLAGVVDTLPSPVRNIAWQSLYRTYMAGKLPAAVKATMDRPAALREVANSVRAIMVPTKLMRDIFLENGIKPELIHHVPFGIDTAPLEPFQTKNPSDTLRIGFIGTIFEHKGVDLLVRAFLQLPSDANAVLKIFGDPNQFPDYTKRVRELLAPEHPNAHKVSLEGAFANDRIGEVLSNLDLLVIPSRWYENTPLVLQSALATRTPLVVTDLGGLSELVKDGRNGFVFPLNDADSLKEKLQKFLDDPGLAGRLSANIPPERTIAQMVDDIEAVYKI